MANLNQTLIDVSEKEEKQINTPDKNENKDDTSFPCDMCDRIFPKKFARALHLSKTHNIKTINYTPGIVRQNSKKHMEIRQSLKCTLCSFISKSKPTLKRHIEIHHKDKTAVFLSEPKKRQHKTYNCPQCNLTFDSKYKMDKHMKEHSDGKTLSPERKIPKMNHNKVKEEDPKEVERIQLNAEEKKKELENLQDLLLQTGKEKDELNVRLSKSNEKGLLLEKANEELTKETNYLKAENQLAVKNLNDLDKEYLTQIRDLKKRETQKDHEIIFLKAENEKCTRDINKLDSVYKTQVIELKKSIEQQDNEIKIKNDQLMKNGIIRVDENKAAELHTSLEALVVTETEVSVDTSSKVSFLPPLQGTPETTPKEVTGEAPVDQQEEAVVKELVTLATGKSAGHKRETPQIQPTKKKEQYHCAMSGRTSGILCTFQCISKVELDNHIEEDHRIFPCADRNCMVECVSLDILAKHVSTVHKRDENIISADFKCNICGIKCQTKSVLIEHIKTHKSHKLCKKYAVNKCEESDSECRYKNVILPPGDQICYKCGVTTSSKTDLIKHIKSGHGTEICHNFLANKCDFEKCMFSHVNPVEKISEREMVTPTAPTEADFVDLPPIGPVGRTEERAQPQTPQVEALQDIIRQVTIKEISMHLEQMLPQIIAKISQTITQKNLTPK